MKFRATESNFLNLKFQSHTFNCKWTLDGSVPQTVTLPFKLKIIYWLISAALITGSPGPVLTILMYPCFIKYYFLIGDAFWKVASSKPANSIWVFFWNHCNQLMKTIFSLWSCLTLHGCHLSTQYVLAISRYVDSYTTYFVASLILLVTTNQTIWYDNTDNILQRTDEMCSYGEHYVPWWQHFFFFLLLSQPIWILRPPERHFKICKNFI